MRYNGRDAARAFVYYSGYIIIVKVTICTTSSEQQYKWMLLNIKVDKDERSYSPDNIL